MIYYVYPIILKIVDGLSRLFDETFNIFYCITLSYNRSNQFCSSEYNKYEVLKGNFNDE